MKNKNNKTFTLEEIIELNQKFDDLFLSNDTQGLNTWISSVNNQFLIDSSFSKGFINLAKAKDLLKAEWFLKIILPFVSNDVLLKSFKEVGLKENISGSENYEFLDIFLSLLDVCSLKLLIKNGCKPYQVLHLSQNLNCDLSFYWDELSNEDVNELISSLYLTPFSKKTVNREIFYSSLLQIYGRFDLDSRVCALKKSVIQCLLLLDDQSNISLPVILDMIKMIYVCKGIEAIGNWPEYLGWINKNLNDNYQFKSISDFALNDNLEESKCRGTYLLLDETQSELKVYFLKDAIEKSLELVEMDEIVINPQEIDEFFKL